MSYNARERYSQHLVKEKHSSVSMDLRTTDSDKSQNPKTQQIIGDRE
jgi:hypothetical protein